MHLKQILSTVIGTCKRPFDTFHERRLTAAAATWNRPRHIGIILDGNRRYARAFGLDGVMTGHAYGADKTVEVLDWCIELNIPVVTIWIFSLDNFQRSHEEVNSLLALIERKTREYIANPRVHKNQVRVRYMGHLHLLPESLRSTIRAMEEATHGYNRFHLNIAIAYGGREEILDGFRRYLEGARAAGQDMNQILDGLTSAAIDSSLYTAGTPDPDLIVRTSGEVRLSGFLLWQSAYAEYYFCDVFWPAFRKIDLLHALRSYHDRQRRYGR